MRENLAQNAGVDISKDSLDVHLHPEQRNARFSNDAKGFKAMITWLGERRMAEAGFVLAKVNPARARKFAEAIGAVAKTTASMQPCLRA
jgi:transposase